MFYCVANIMRLGFLKYIKGMLFYKITHLGASPSSNGPAMRGGKKFWNAFFRHYSKKECTRPTGKSPSTLQSWEMDSLSLLHLEGGLLPPSLPSFLCDLIWVGIEEMCSSSSRKLEAKKREESSSGSRFTDESSKGACLLSAWSWQN